MYNFSKTQGTNVTGAVISCAPRVLVSILFMTLFDILPYVFNCLHFFDLTTISHANFGYLQINNTDKTGRVIFYIYKKSRHGIGIDSVQMFKKPVPIPGTCISNVYKNGLSGL